MPEALLTKSVIKEIQIHSPSPDLISVGYVSKMNVTFAASNISESAVLKASSSFTLARLYVCASFRLFC